MTRPISTVLPACRLALIAVVLWSTGLIASTASAQAPPAKERHTIAVRAQGNTCVYQILDQANQDLFVVRPNGAVVLRAQNGLWVDVAVEDAEVQGSSGVRSVPGGTKPAQLRAPSAGSAGRLHRAQRLGGRLVHRAPRAYPVLSDTGTWARLPSLAGRPAPQSCLRRRRRPCLAARCWHPHDDARSGSAPGSTYAVALPPRRPCDARRGRAVACPERVVQAAVSPAGSGHR